MGWLFHSIKGKIVLMTVLIVGFGFGSFETFGYYTSKANAVAELTKLSDIKADRLAENLVLPLWEVDEEWATKVVEAEMADKRIYAVMVTVDGELFLSKQRDNSWAVIDSNEVESGDFIMRDRAIMHDGKVFGDLQILISEKFMYDDLYRKLKWESLALLMISLMMLGGLMISLNRVVVQRIQQVLAVAEEIAAGDYSGTARNRVTGNDEVGLLGDGIEIMRRNIQEREAALRESESRFRSLVDNAASGFFLHGLDGSIKDVNKQAVEMMGWSREELLEMNISDFQTEFTSSQLETLWKGIDDRPKIVEGTHRRKGGSTFPVEVRVSRVDYKGTPHMIALANDISERRQAEERVKRYYQAMEQSGEAIVITDVDGVIEHVNPAFTEITGYGEDESIGAKASILKSGNQNASVYEEMWKVISAGKTWRGKVINRKKSGEFYPAMLTISPILNNQGQIDRFIGIQQNLEQLEALEAQFRQSQKMEAIGTLVGGIAHDFNNTLAGITGNIYLAKNEAASLPEVVDRLTTIERLSFSAAGTIRQLLTFSRKGIVHTEPISISSFLKETMKLQAASIPENIQVQTEVVDSDLTVKCDVNQMQQVIMNLVNNAIDALAGAENPSITLQIERFDVDAEFVKKHDDFHAQAAAHISVSDNGHGIKPEDVDHLFEPFFTTKGPDEGTGLGLAMVFGAIQSHEGVIEVSSSQEKPSGTTMHIYLPLMENSGVVEEMSDHQVGEGGSETILIVDDNELVLETAQSVLESMGYRVITANDGVEALERYREHLNQIELVILDVVMPRMGGVEAYKALKEITPSLKVMFATGYDRSSTIEGIEGYESIPVIGKPFSADELNKVIRQLLNQKE